ncbi:hypothetical protein FRB98_006251 [Tulasnella sp. 332]|nr:hypothetical protein FRB98_006251 [Tulasnella sp. 332]
MSLDLDVVIDPSLDLASAIDPNRILLPTSVDGVLHWPLPRLETLTIESPILDIGALLGLIRARPEVEEAPSRLKSPELIGRLARHINELEYKLGYGVASCCIHASESSFECDIFEGSDGANGHNCSPREEGDRPRKSRCTEEEDEEGEGEGKRSRKRRRLDDDDDNYNGSDSCDDDDNNEEWRRKRGNEEAEESEEEKEDTDDW